MPFLNRDGVSIFYNVEPAEDNNKPIVCFTHGSGSGSGMWDKQVEALQATGKYRTVVWDMRGHAKSDSPEDTSKYSKQAQVDDLKAVLEAAGASPSRPAILAGHSMGGMDQMLFYLFHPEYVKGFILYATGPGFAKESGWQGWNKMSEGAAKNYEKKGLNALVGSDKTKGHRSAQGLANVMRYVLKQRKEDPLFQKLAEGPLHLANHVEEIKVPCLVTCGEKDKTFFGSTQMLAQKIAGSQLEIVPGAGHMMCESKEYAPKFNEKMVAFIEKTHGTGVGQSKL